MSVKENNSDYGSLSSREAVSRSHVLSRIRERIVTGVIPAGGKVPDRRTLATEFSVSTFTVQRALERLESDGFIESVRRRGTFVRPRPPHLCHYGLIFHDAPDGKKSWSRFWAGLTSEARAINASGGARQISIYHGIDGHSDTEAYHRLVSEVRRDRFAGLAFTSTPARGLLGTPVFTHPNLPRVAMHEEKWMPGVKGVAPEPYTFLQRALDEVAARGRRRVAILTSFGEPQDLLSVAIPWATARGLELPRTWVQNVDSHWVDWGGQLVELLFDRPDGERPDALIIDDDNLVEAATAGLLRTRAGAGGEVLVVNHCNFPYPPHSLVPSIKIGFDLRRWLDNCFETIDHLRRGEKDFVLPRIEAVREDQLSSQDRS